MCDQKSTRNHVANHVERLGKVRDTSLQTGQIETVFNEIFVNLHVKLVAVELTKPFNPRDFRAVASGLLFNELRFVFRAVRARRAFVLDLHCWQSYFFFFCDF